ncbi:MAG: HAMP domain-containing histidine kinase [Rhodocyclaceae bacterium]|nr:HAMP domain-containing histidine kinase [Rhodocyclaceae bacterium]
MPVVVAVIVLLVFRPLYEEAETLIRDEVHGAIEEELASLEDHFHDRGMDSLVAEIGLRMDSPRDPDAAYLLLDPGGRRLVGNLAQWPDGLAVGDDAWFRYPTAAGQFLEGKVLALFGGHHLLVGRVSPLAHFRDEMQTRLWVAAGLIVLVTALAAALFSAYVHGRLARMATDVDAIRNGHLSARLRTRTTGDELDALAVRFNAAFDEIEQLFTASRQVTDAIAHDMRRPLIRLRIAIDEAIARGDRSNDPETALPPLLEQIDRLLATFGALLRLGRIESGAWAQPSQHCSLREIVEDAADLVRPAAQDAGRSLHTATSDAVLRGDRELLAQMVINLLDNALAHGRGDIRVTLVASGSEIRLCVEDQGPGVPAEDLERIFDRFYRVDPARGSAEHSGIGLPIARAIARFHGGHLTAANTDPGFCMTVALPAGRAGPSPDGPV